MSHPVKKPTGVKKAVAQPSDKTTTKATKADPVQNDKGKDMTSASPLKRSRADETAPKPPTKRLKTKSALNSPPTKKLDIYVVGDGESGELGLGPKSIDDKPPTGVTYPRRNKLLDAFGITQVAAGGMHCVALTAKNDIVTWGVNDNGALGRDTTWEAPTKDIDAGSDSDDSSDDGDLSPKESTPTIVSQIDLGKGAHTFVQVVAADSASFALTSTGSVFGWGSFRANDGPLGFFSQDAIKAAKTKNEEMKFQRKPARIPSLTKITSLAAGNNHVLALNDKGRIDAWGTGEQSQLGRRIVERTRYTALAPARLGLTNIKQVACGACHSFAVNKDGLVYAWGLNNFGQTGISDGAGEGEAVIHSPTVVENLRQYKIRQIQGGEHHSIACTEDGTLLIWGRCDEGQAGINCDTIPKEDLLFDSREKPRILLKPTVIPSISGVVSVAAGIDNSFAITKEGKVYSWGYSENYRTGLGTEKAVKEPTLLQKGDIKDKQIIYTGCGGQFSILAGTAGS